jgi:hypothetical protein
VSSRWVDGQELLLSASGWIYNNRFVLYDYETESLWYCLQGDCRFTCVSGTYADKQLLGLPSTLINWNQWKQLHPETKVLQYPVPEEPGEPQKQGPPDIRRDS